MTSFSFRKRVRMMIMIATVVLLFASGALFAAGTDSSNSVNYNVSIVCLSAAIAFGIGALAAGMAIGKVGSAAMGAISERPEIASQALIFIALAEGLVVFGFITALMILGKV